MGDWVIMFTEATSKEQINEYISRLEAQGIKLKYDYTALMKAIAVSDVPDSFTSSFAREPIIEVAEPDGVATTQGGGGSFGI